MKHTYLLGLPLKRCRFVGVGMTRNLVAIASVVLIAACGGADSASSDSTGPGSEVASTAPLPTTPTGAVELCSLVSTDLPGSADQPATNEELAKSLNERAATLIRIAESSSGELADALRQSGDAMTRLAKSVESGTDPGALEGLMTELSSDEKFSAAQTVIDEAVASSCKEDEK